MKLKICIAIAALFLSCSNDKKQTETVKQVAKFKSDVLLENTVVKPLSGTDSDTKHEFTLTISGKNVLDGTATFKILDKDGEEVECKTFPSKQLIQKEYRTANSALQEVHIREVVESYFDDENALAFL